MQSPWSARAAKCSAARPISRSHAHASAPCRRRHRKAAGPRQASQQSDITRAGYGNTCREAPSPCPTAMPPSGAAAAPHLRQQVLDHARVAFAARQHQWRQPRLVRAIHHFLDGGVEGRACAGAGAGRSRRFSNVCESAARRCRGKMVQVQEVWAGPPGDVPYVWVRCVGRAGPRNM